MVLKNVVNQMCSTCNLDEVSLMDIPKCVFISLKDMYEEICHGKIDKKSFLKKDRIYYIIIIVLILLFVVRGLHINKHQQPDESFWELDARWYS